MRAWSFALLVLVLGGCVQPAEPGDQIDEVPFQVDVYVPVQDHDHKDPALHQQAYGLDLVSFVDAGTLLGDERARLSDLQFHGDLATVVLNGRGGATAGGFLVLDVSDPTNVSVLGRYRSGSEDNWYTKWSPDGRYVFLTANGGTGPMPLVDGVRDSLASGTATGAARGIHVVDVADPSAPGLVWVHPVPVRAVNLAVHTDHEGTIWVFASVVGADGLAGLDAGLGEVEVLRMDPATRRLETVTSWSPSTWFDVCPGASAFPHDLSIHAHPDGQNMLYVAYWDQGYWIVDVSDPTDPRTVSGFGVHACSEHAHTFKQHPTPVGDRILAVASPETFAGESGTYRIVDVTDPTTPTVLSRWTLPGALTITEPLLFSPHEFSLANGRLYTSDFHGGAWVVDLDTGEPVATWQRSLGDPARTGAWALDIETAVFHDGLLWLVDMGSGIYVLEEDFGTRQT